MRLKSCRFAALAAFAWNLALAACCPAAEPTPPEGFRAIFNGDDLTGWHGLNPHPAAKLTGDDLKANLGQQRAEFPQHWRVEDGALVNDGHGPYATTDEEFGDIELRLQYKTVPGADSGIYLRGTPQVQIWDWNQKFDPKNPQRRPQLGSGGLFNNDPNSAGRDPLVHADRPFGEWNDFRIRQIGNLTWVWLNDQLVVDGAAMENYWDRSQPLPARGPIMLQTHGGEIRWRNIFVREIGADEAKESLAKADVDTRHALVDALTLHASFDGSLNADFAKGDANCYESEDGMLIAAEASESVKLEPSAGRFGGALHFTRKSNERPLFKDNGNLGYNDQSWSASVSLWLRLNPDEDLEPGYCDPVQIIGEDTKRGFIFLEWSKDDIPRHFRYAIRPLFEIWNPMNLAWDAIPAQERPMVQVERAPFSRDAWTHAVFTFDNLNDKSAEPGKPAADGKPNRQVGRLFLNGKPQGAVENWDMTFGWDPEQVRLVLGAAYVGYLDDLAVFNRAITDGEVRYLYELERGVAELR
jgi:hypothetical protein